MKRDRMIHVRLNKEEEELLNLKSAQSCMSQSEFVRKLIVDSTVHVIPVADDICMTFAYVYDALNVGTSAKIKLAIDRMDQLCVALFSAVKQSTEADQ